MMKYIQIRLWDYWWAVYQCGESDPALPSGVEFALTDDEAGRAPFFHFDFYNLPGLRALLREGEFLSPESPDHPLFLQRAEALEQGGADYFVGALYYPDFTPDLAFCGLSAERGIPLPDLRSSPTSPCCAAVFLAEERPLSPQILMRWASRLSLSLFGRRFSCRMAHVPTRSEALALRQAETDRAV